MPYENVVVAYDSDVATITMNRPERRNALSSALLRDLLAAFAEVGSSEASGVVLAGAGPVFSAGHDFGEVAGSDVGQVSALLGQAARLAGLIQSIPQPVIARVHALATAAGCQLVAACDLAVAADTAGFAAPGGKGGWFCHTPMVEIARNIGRKRAAEMAFTGDVITAATALDWGLVNVVVPAAELDAAVEDLLARATRGSRQSKALGKSTLYAQLPMADLDAYELAIKVMAEASQGDAAREGMAAFLAKRSPVWPA